MTVTMRKRIGYRCKICGSDEIVFDAYAGWSEKNQEMFLHSTYDEVRCNECGGYNCEQEIELS